MVFVVRNGGAYRRKARRASSSFRDAGVPRAMACRCATRPRWSGFAKLVASICTPSACRRRRRALAARLRRLRRSLEEFLVSGD